VEEARAARLWRMAEEAWAAQTFGSLHEMLHFCIATEGGPKMDHGHEASVGDCMSELQCIFKTHFGL
jgi:hypothetical protein